MKIIKRLQQLRRFGTTLLRFGILVKLGNLILPVYRFHWMEIGWWDDAKFIEYLSRFETHTLNDDRRWMLYQLFRLTAGIAGDTAECGVYTGAGSYLICRMNQEPQFAGRTHFMFDSFEGLSQPAPVDGPYWRKGDLVCLEDVAHTNLAPFENSQILKGWIPTRFAEVADRRFSFVHIDVDLHGPTRDSIEFFYPRMNDGGIIVCDDYRLTTCPGATAAIDDFLKDKPEKMLSLSSGGGFLIKGRRTGDELEVVLAPHKDEAQSSR